MVAYFALAGLAIALSCGPRVVLAARVRTSRCLPGWLDRSGAWNVFDYATVLVLIAFSGLRIGVGRDWDEYERNFALADPSSWWESTARSPLDLGYTQLTLILKALSPDPTLLFMVTSALCVVPAYVVMKRKSWHLPTSVAIYVLLAFYLAPLNLVRQGIAVALNMLASLYISKRLPAFIALNALATTFHGTAALVALLQLAVHRWRPTIRQVAFASSMSIALAGILALFPLALWAAAILPRYAEYLTISPTGIGTYLVTAAKLGLLITALVLSSNRLTRPYAAFVVVGVVMLILGTQYSAIARLELYFGIYLALVIPEALGRPALSAGLRRLLRGAIGVGSLVYFAMYLTFYGDLLPYRAEF